MIATLVSDAVLPALKAGGLPSDSAVGIPVEFSRIQGKAETMHCGKSCIGKPRSSSFLGTRLALATDVKSLLKNGDWLR
jgi:hypothetical protein